MSLGCLCHTATVNGNTWILAGTVSKTRSVMKPQQQQGGGSRAAKKRAKKKNKNKNKQRNQGDDDKTVEKKDLGKPVVHVTESKKRPLEEKDTEKSTSKKSHTKGSTDDTTKKPSNGGGILKKPKYASESSAGVDKKDPTPLNPEDQADEAMQEEDMNNEQDLDVALPAEIQELVNSEQVNLKDILLLSDDKKDKPKQSTNTKNNVDESDDSNDDDSIDANPFQDLTSKQRARCALNFLLAPAEITAEELYEQYWEKKALCVQAKKDGNNKNHHQHRLDGFLSLKSIRQLTEKHTLHYGRDLNVTRYHTVTPGQPKRRANLDPPPYQDAKTGETKYVQVDSDFCWEQYDEKQATIRLLCPHKHNNDVHALLSLLELEWGCMVGANAYLTPPGGSQGFAPHFDDIEAFCLQLEGRKRWKVYAPAKEARLPRVSSEDFTEDDMREQEPVLDVVLEPGDLLYMPRGWIHQGITLPAGAGNKNNNKEHSLHLTVSAMQQWAWVDYLELLMPEALEAAANSETSISLRKGLPRNFLDYMGAMYDQREDDNLPDRLKEGGGNKEGAKDGNDDNNGMEDAEGVAVQEEAEAEAEQRQRIRQMQENFRNEAKKRIMRVAKEAMDMVDAACDQIGKRFLSDRLPPSLTPDERACTSEGQKDAKIWPTTLCRLARPGIARLVLEDGKAVLYHCADNSRVYHEVPLSPMEFEVDDAPALEQLITTVEPQWIPVSDLIHEAMEDKIAIAQSLYDEGILAIFNANGNPS